MSVSVSKFSRFVPLKVTDMIERIVWVLASAMFLTLAITAFAVTPA